MTTRRPTPTEQKLVDIAWQLVYTDHFYGRKDMTPPELASWVAEQLRACGFETEELGSSYHYLTGVKE